MIKKLLSHTALYGLVPQLPMVIGIFILPIITKDLTETDYGIAAVVQAYTMALNTLHGLGIGVVLTNSFFVYPNTYRWLWRQLHGFLTLWSLLYGLILGVILFFTVPDAANENLISIILLNIIPPIFFNTTQLIVFKYYQLSQRPGPIATRSVIVGMVTLFLNLYFISYLKMGYMGWFWSNCISASLGFIIFIHPIYIKEKMLPIFNFKMRTVRKALKVSLPTVPHSYSGYILNTSDRLILDWLKVGTAKMGLYGFASNFGNYFGTFGIAVTMATSPMYRKLYKESETDISKFKDARTLTFFLQVSFFVIAFVCCLWMREIFILLVNNATLREVYPLTIIIFFGFTYRPMYAGVTNMFFYWELTAKLWRYSFMAGVVNVALNFIFIPIFGYEAAAFTTAAALMYMGYSGYFMKDYLKRKDIEYYPLRWLFATIVLGFTVYAIKDIDILYKVIISSALAVAYYFYFNRSGIKSISSI